MGLLESKKPVDWSSWVNRELAEILQFYIEIEWCKFYPQDQLKQYKAFLHAANQFDRQAKGILRNIIRVVPGLKMYMVKHSVFRVGANREDDWFVQFMMYELMPTDEEIQKELTLPGVPEEYLARLRDAGFDPGPIGMTMDNIRIEYKLWGHPRRGESPHPINIIDIDWEKINKNFAPDPEQFIAQYEEIEAAPAIPAEAYTFEEDDLPF